MSARCVMCGSSNVELWTLETDLRIAVTYLCKQDAAPIITIMDATRDLPPSMQVPLSEKAKMEPQPQHHFRHSRMAVLQPLTDWVPPTEPPLVKRHLAPPKPEPRPKKEVIHKEKKAAKSMEPLFWSPEEDHVPLIPDRNTPS